MYRPHRNGTRKPRVIDTRIYIASGRLHQNTNALEPMQNRRVTAGMIHDGAGDELTAKHAGQVLNIGHQEASYYVTKTSGIFDEVRQQRLASQAVLQPTEHGPGDWVRFPACREPPMVSWISPRASHQQQPARPTLWNCTYYFCTDLMALHLASPCRQRRLALVRHKMTVR